MFSRKSGGGNALYEQMVESMPINVMTCNLTDFRIDYVNSTARETLNSIAHVLPIPPEEVLGTCIDIFHKMPERQREILRDPANLPHQARINLGDEFLDLFISAMFDGQENYVKPMVTWNVVTDQVRQQRDTEQLVTMIDNMPINVMMADPETFEIKFANKTSLKTLEGLEQYLPIKAKDLVGTNIDVFHKNPSHQRQLLADPRNLPHKATISVGPEKLSLNVAAITDEDGNYLGPMVNWSVITQNVRVAENVKSVTSTVAAGVEDLTATAQSLTETASGTNSQAQALAAAAEQLSSSAQEIGQQVIHAANVSRDAVEKTAHSNELVAGLAETAEKIGEVVKLINDIANQTNLLALNATIEAARAG